MAEFARVDPLQLTRRHPRVSRQAGILQAAGVVACGRLNGCLVLEPAQQPRRDHARVATLKRIAFLAAAILFLSAFLGGVTYDSYQTATAEQDIRGSIDAMLDDPAYAGYERVDFEVQTTREYLLFHRPTTVVVTVGVPPDAARTGVAADLEARIAADHGLDVDVHVRYLEIERSS